MKEKESIFPITDEKMKHLADENARSFNLEVEMGRNINMNLVSDGYHTFGELYEHRITNFIALCRIIDGGYPNIMVVSQVEPNTIKKMDTGNPVWRSKKHSDGELAFGGTWFVLGISKEKGKQITYHLPIKDWSKTSFAEELEQAPEWDGHSSEDVLERLSKLWMKG